MIKYAHIAIPTKEGFRLTNPSDIIYCQADGHHTQLFLTGNQMIDVNKKLKEVGGLLEEEVFVRIHHSTIINLSHLKEYLNSPTNLVRMSNGVELAVSLRKKKQLMSLFRKF